jgi:hypothetical protein
MKDMLYGQLSFDFEEWSWFVLNSFIAFFSILLDIIW